MLNIKSLKGLAMYTCNKKLTALFQRVTRVETPKF